MHRNIGATINHFIIDQVPKGIAIQYKCKRQIVGMLTHSQRNIETYDLNEVGEDQPNS